MPDVPQQFANNPEDSDVVGLFRSKKFDKDGVGLALSGGGYKAAAYHVGALIRLNELGWLPKLNRIISVSGGSITAGFLGAEWSKLTFDGNGVATNFNGAFVQPLRDFLTEVNLDVWQGIAGLLNPFKSAADGVAKGYDKHLFHGRTLQDLPVEQPGTPRFTLLATNYELNSLWRFSRSYAADYNVGMIDAPRFPLAQIVAASSAFPPFFCPIELDLSKETIKQLPGANHHSGDFLKRALLADGGIYDNMGLEPIWKRYGTLLVSNAGNIFDEDHHPGDWGRLMMRIISMMHRQAENNRQRMLMLLVEGDGRKIGYWPLRNDQSKYPKQSAVVLTPAEVQGAQGEGVRLWSLGNKGFANLVNHGYSLCDAAMKSYVLTSAPPPAARPF